jgi:hypothetical protein
MAHEFATGDRTGDDAREALDADEGRQPRRTDRRVIDVARQPGRADADDQAHEKHVARSCGHGVQPLVEQTPKLAGHVQPIPKMSAAHTPVCGPMTQTLAVEV